MNLRRLAPAVAVASGLLCVPIPPSHAAEQVGCVIYPHKTVRISWHNQDADNVDYAVYGSGEQLCLPGLYLTQAIKLCLDERQDVHWAPDKWVRVKCQGEYKWTTGQVLQRHIKKVCDTTAETKWRVYVWARFKNQYGEDKYGRDWSEAREHRCHEWYTDND